MTRCAGKLRAWILTGLCAASGWSLTGRGDTPADAALGDNPYRAIVARNAFRLKDPVPLPPPPTNALVAEKPKVDIKLAGLGEIAGVRYAYLVVPDADHPGQFDYPALTDDPRRGPGVRYKGGIEVRSIDLKAQTVRLMNGGLEATLDLKEDGVKNVASAATKVPPPTAGGRIVHPTLVGAGGANAAEPSTGSPLIFSRNPNRASDGTVTPATAGNTTWNAAARVANTLLPAPSGAASLPTRPLRTETAVTQTPAQPPEVTAQQQYEVYLRQKQVADSLGVPIPPLPIVQTIQPVPPNQPPAQ